MSIATRLVLLASLALTACATPSTTGVAPSGHREQKAQPFVIAANPLAAQAGIEVLKRGGSAVDAAVAVQAMLSLVEPQSSGVGGGAFMSYYDAASRKIIVYDGREVAPAQASPAMFLDFAGQPLPFADAVLSGRSTGVPGAVAILALAQAEHGRLAWHDLFGSAIRTAERGFTVSPRLGRLIAGDFPQNHAPDEIAYFRNPDGSRMKAGDTLRNPAYARFLDRLALHGAPALYAGETGARIVARDPRRAARRVDDHGRSCRVPPGRARAIVPSVSNLPRLCAAPAIRRSLGIAIARPARADRYRQPRASRPARLVPVCPSEPPDVRRPRSI